MTKILFLLSLIPIGCAGGPSTFSESLGSAAPATGQIAMQNRVSDRPMSGVIFENRGTRDISISQIHIVLVGGAAVDSPSGGVGVRSGDAVTYLFSPQLLQRVDNLSFRVEGSTEELVVLPTQQTGIVP
jgi:hypothetical protein